MDWVETLNGQTVGLDIAPFIYFIEENPLYLETICPFFEAIDQGKIRAVTSIVTLLEVLVHPFRHRDSALAQQYREILLNAEGFTTITLSQEIAEESARLRAQHNIPTPDAIQLATALHGEASLFLTNDARLPSLPDLQVLVLDRLLETES